MGTSGAGQLALWVASGLLCACAAVSPRFGQPVATSFVSQPMRRMETQSSVIYYPAAGREQAERIGARMDACLEKLSLLPFARKERGKVLVYLTSANFNNAYVSGQALGEPLHTVNPLQLTSETFSVFNLGLTETGDVGCHELVHYVQLQQVDGLWGGVNRVLGPVFPSQAFLESWFLEGLAQYYEGRLDRAVGRPHSPFYRGAYEAGVAERGGHLGAGDLNLLHRDHLPFSGAYVTGLHFVEYLAEKYGERKLWKLVDEQGQALLPFLAVTLRARQLYGKSIGALFEDYSQELQRRPKPRTRPPSQRVLWPELGYIARLAGSQADGAVAVVSAGRGEVVQLSIHERDGSLRFARPLARFTPVRPWIFAHPLTVSGLSFTADGRWLYLLNDDLDDLGEMRAQLWKVDAQSGEVEVLLEGMRAVGGSVSPDGTRYSCVEVEGEISRLVEIDLRTRARTPLLEARATLAAPAYAPDGLRIAFVQRQGTGYSLGVRHSDGRVDWLLDQGFHYTPKWVDERRLLLLRERNGLLQAHLVDLERRSFAPVSAAPYVVLDPVPVGGEDFAFLNRDGFGWSLDAAPLEPQAEPQPLPQLEPPEAEAPAALQKLSDEPYSPLDGLFLPSLHAPFALITSEGTGETARLRQLYGVSLRGQDALTFHAWALNALLYLPSRDNVVSVEYGTQLLAPWFARLHLSRQQRDGALERLGDLRVGRSFWTTPLTLGFSALSRTELASGGAAAPAVTLVGPSLSFDYLAAESTPYGGLQRALGFAGGVQAFPKELGSDLDMMDLQGQVTLAPRVPLSDRHSLAGSLRARALPGAPEGLLQVGGVILGSPLWGSTPPSGPGPVAINLPGGLAFVEAVRGYEDYSARASKAAVAHARYRYSLIIDRGWASTAYLLPSLFIRQLELELFASSAFTDGAEPILRAAGGALFLRAAMMQALPLALYYQFSTRFDAGLPPMHLFGLIGF